VALALGTPGLAGIRLAQHTLVDAVQGASLRLAEPELAPRRFVHRKSAKCGIPNRAITTLILGDLATLRSARKSAETPPDS